MSEAISVTGAAGLLGANLARDFAARGREVRAVTHRCRLTKYVAATQLCHLGGLGVQLLLDRIVEGCSWVVHCAASSNVDWCETHPEAARLVNVEGTAQVARAAARAGSRMVYISTDSVFDGLHGPYRERDRPAPLNVYARTKLAGERVATEICPSCLVVRTNIFGWNARPKNSLAEWMVESLRVGDGFTGFDNVCFNPLLVNDLGDALLDLMARGLEGTVHVAASDSCSKYDFGIQVAKLFGCDARLIQKGRYSEESTGARRPLAPILSVDYAQRRLGRALPTVAEGLARFKGMQDNGSVRDIRSMVENTRDGRQLQNR